MQNPIVYIIPGWNSDGKYATKIKEALPHDKYDVRIFEYGQPSSIPGIKGVINLIANRWRIKDTVEWLIDIIETEKQLQSDRDIYLIGHSNGGLIAYHVDKRVDVKKVVLFNAALDRDSEFKAGVLNFYCETDWTVKLLARIRLFSKWGDYGSRENKGAVNVNMKQFGVKRHSDFINYLDRKKDLIIRFFNDEIRK